MGVIVKHRLTPVNKKLDIPTPSRHQESRFATLGKNFGPTTLALEDDFGLRVG